MVQETFIKLETKDGKQYRGTRSFEGLLERIDKLQQNVWDFECRVRSLESPQRQKQILRILKHAGTRSHNYFASHILNFSESDIDELVNKGKVAELRHGTRLMYSLVHSPVKES